ncbi:MAG: RDD family protein [Faecalibacillus sp.]
MKKQSQKINRKYIGTYDIVKIRTRRFGAMLIDWYLTHMIAAIPITFYLRGNDYLRTTSFQLETYGFQTGLIYGLSVITFGIIYYLIIPTFLWKGQTLGKKICHLYVIKKDGCDVTFKDMFLREIIGATFLEGGIVITASYIRKLLQLFGLINIVTPLKYISYTLTLASIIYAYFQPLSISFHDKIADTVVIKKN